MLCIQRMAADANDTATTASIITGVVAYMESTGPGTGGSGTLNIPAMGN